jgi:hypothetical protein
MGRMARLLPAPLREAVGSLSRTLSTQGLAVEPLLMPSNGGLAKAANIDRQDELS